MSVDVLLNNNLILSDVLRELSNNEEKQFVLHNFSSTQTTPHNNNKVCPETKQPIQVTMAVDRATQTILKRVDIALSEHSHQTPTEDGKFTMSVSRNDQNGIDIHLPHGLLRSSCLGQNRTQYSLLTSPTSNKPILQKVLPAIKGQQDESNGIISAEEMEALVRYASHYLDNLENKYSHRLSITNGREIDFSNMSDLEKVSKQEKKNFFLLRANRNSKKLLCFIPHKKILQHLLYSVYILPFPHIFIYFIHIVILNSHLLVLL